MCQECSDIRQHAFDVHLPTTFDETLSPKDEAPLRAWALRMATRWILGSRASVEDLVTKVEGLGLLQCIGGLQVSPAQSAVMDGLCEALSLPLPGTITGYSCSPLNSPSLSFPLAGDVGDPCGFHGNPPGALSGQLR